ncbi:hypothetical protein [Geminicoccus flavidas]|uniref:hypothetical protein n=1 Tax=Geminicoccus flavidas TaxID=2506407 RepID=UPI0013571131|nr:hypothetical protein [Geminicoccus flavidas]
MAAAVDALGADEKYVAQVARGLRERDLFIRETKSPRSWRPSPQDAARLIAAVMTGCPAMHAADRLEALLGARMASSSWDHAQMLPAWFQKLCPLLFMVRADGERSSFVDAIEDVISIALLAPDIFDKWNNRFAFELEQNTLSGTFHFNLPPSTPLVSAEPVANAILHFEPHLDVRPKMQVTAKVEWEHIQAFAQALSQ